MRISNHYKSISLLLILLSIASFFIGFFYGENSAGAGTLHGDFNNLWMNLQTFLNNDLSTAIDFTANSDREIFQSSRTPLIYILHKVFNPFTHDKISFINSIFIISLSVPFLFYLCLKQKFQNEDNLLLVLISTTICLSPYFRTSAYWGLEENYSIITLLLTFLFLNQFLSNDNSLWKNSYQIFLVGLSSSLCIYFDQKLAIIPLICFFCIFFSKKSINLKILLFLLYFVFSIPYIYLITIWGNIIPTGDATARGIGSKIYFNHIGYTSTIIAFYLLPFLLYKKNSFLDQIKRFFKEKKNYYLISLFFIYLIYLLTFYDYDTEVKLGKGFIHKIAILIFKESLFQEIFIYFAFFISWIIILIYLENNFKDKLIIFYFFIISIIIWPILQEYFDPIIVLMGFTFLNTKLFLNYRGSILFFLYLSVLLISSNIYYYNLLN